MWERGEKNTRRGIQSQTTYYKVAFRRGSASSRRVEPSFIAVNLNHDPSESPARNSFQIVFLPQSVGTESKPIIFENGA